MPPRKRTSPKAPADGKQHPLNMRASTELRRRIEEAARFNGNSLSREVERRIERSFDRQDLVSEVMELAYDKPKAQVLLAVGNNEHNLYWAVKELIWQLQRDGKEFKADLNPPPPTDEEFDRMVKASERFRQQEKKK